MSKGPESLFKEKVISALRTLPNIWIVKINQVNIVGTPDILGCANGNFFALELKGSSKAKASKMQLHTIDKILKARGIAFLVYPENWEEIFSYISQLAHTSENKPFDLPSH